MNINHKARHDQFFKHHFSHKEQVVDYLKAKMPVELLGMLNLSTLEKKKDTFPANRLRGPRQADVIWSTRPKGEEESSKYRTMFERARQRAHQQGMQSIAKQMLAKGMQKSLISEITSLSLGDINAL